MTTVEFTLSYMLRNSGEVVSAAEHTDVRLARRDGSDLFVGTVRREMAVRDGLDMAARALSTVLADARLADRALAAIEGAMPWIGWLDRDDRAEFAESFVRTVSACHDTGNYEPLARMLNRWLATAQIAQSPELSAVLAADRGDDEPVTLHRPPS